MKLFLLAITFTCTLFAGTYDSTYNPHKSAEVETDILMTSEFKEIIRFDMLWYQDGKINTKTQETFDKIVETVKNYNDKQETMILTVIGHTDKPTDDANEKTIDSDTYANKIQNQFRYSLSEEESETNSKNYAQNTKELLLDQGINEDIIQVEYRSGKDQGFSHGVMHGRDLSNRVMVALYVMIPKDVDSDADGVFDRLDKCKNTPIGLDVDSEGCPFDSDKDGVVDSKDMCPNTPAKVVVDLKGCPLDSDGDGVADFQDICPNTLKGIKVDSKGCPVSKTLNLNFKTNSSKLFRESHPKIVEFANFLKLYPSYQSKIIGHTDSVGEEGLNMKLSLARAETVKAALINEGIDASRLKASGKGELEPLADNRSKDGRRLNRRIEVTLSY